MQSPIGEPLLEPYSYEDAINSPAHYTQSIECIDAMRAMTEGTTVPVFQAFLWQNSFKYLWRWPKKSVSGIKDLKKCRWYIDALIKELEAEL